MGSLLWRSEVPYSSILYFILKPCGLQTPGPHTLLSMCLSFISCCVSLLGRLWTVVTTEPWTPWGSDWARRARICFPPFSSLLPAQGLACWRATSWDFPGLWLLVDLPGGQIRAGVGERVGDDGVYSPGSLAGCLRLASTEGISSREVALFPTDLLHLCVLLSASSSHPFRVKGEVGAWLN